MEVTSSSQAASSSPSTHQGPLGSSHSLAHSAGDEATGGEEPGDAQTPGTSDYHSSPTHYGTMGSTSLPRHHHLSLDVAVPSSSLTIGVVSPSSVEAEGDNLNNAVDFGTGMELVRYGPAYPPFYSSDNLSYSKDVRDSKAVHGSCGLYNLGNTCFMNAGLQSLMSCAPLVKFFCESYALSDSTRHTLSAHFYMLLCKIWSGQFSVVHPRKFKDFLGMYHSQFEDYRQHDCQEFLALLLDTLHEQLNKASVGLYPGSSASPRQPALTGSHGEEAPGGSTAESGAQASSEGANSSISLNNKDLSEDREPGSSQGEALASPQGDTKEASVAASYEKADVTSDHPSPVSPLSDGSPTSEVSILESVMTSPSSQADTASSSKSPERTVVLPGGGSERGSEEEEVISSSFPPLQRYTSRQNMDDVTSSDSGVLLIRPSLKRVSSGSSMSTSCGQLVLHSEDSNHSSLSAHSTDSEQSSAFKRLKIEAGADLGRNSSSNNSNHLKDCVTSSSDCSKKGTIYGKDSGSGNAVRSKLLLREVVGAGSDVSLLQDHSVVDNMVSSCQADPPACSSVSNLHSHEAQAVSQSLNKRGDPSCPGPVVSHQSMTPLGLPCLDDFYSKETKTLNTNVQVSEFLQEITVDSEKFAKVDNRNRSPSKEVNILQEAFEDENKAEKVLIGESLGSGVKETNLYAQSSNGSMVKPCKNVDLNVLHNSLGEAPVLPEESSKLMSMCQPGEASVAHKDDSPPLKLVDDGLTGVAGVNTSGFKFDEEEKNVQMQAYSKFNTIPVRSNIREDLSNTLDTDSMEVDEVEIMESSDDDDLELAPSSHMSTVEACSSVPNCLRYNCPASEVKVATSAWEEYHARNNSVVVNTFQGQFRSTVVCSECSHVSVTYEPFMYLSLPIPHAMDQQICVTYISEHRPPIKYLLNLLKTDKVSAAKQQLNQLLGRPADSELVVAEVLDSHISRILDNNVLLKYVNTFNRNIYAFEIITIPSSHEISTTSPQSQEAHYPTSSLTHGHHEASPSMARLGLSGPRDCPETSNQSFDSVMVNSPSSRDTLEGMMSDSEGCEADFLTFSSTSAKSGRQAQAASPTSVRVPGDSGDGVVRLCLPTSSAEPLLQGNDWFIGDCVGASRLPCTYDEDYDKEDHSDAGETFLSKQGKESFMRESRSSKISSSSPVEAEQSSSHPSECGPSSAPSQFWIDEHGSEKSRMMLEEDEDNEADAGPAQDVTLTDSYSLCTSEAEQRDKSDISTSETLQSVRENSIKADGAVHEHCLSQLKASPSSSPVMPSGTTSSSSTPTVSSSSSSSNHHHSHEHYHSRDLVSSSQGGRVCSPAVSPCHSDEEEVYPYAHITTGSTTGHLSRSCPSPKNFSEMRGQEEEATLLGAAAKLGENPGSYFLQSRRTEDYDEEDFYSDQGEGSTVKEEASTSGYANSHNQEERECGGPDWSNTFPVHNFTASDVQHGATASLSDQWKSCAICLEDLLDSELLTHVMCDGVFCQNCLEMSVKHTVDVSAFSCPICLQPANMCEDFVPLASTSGARPKIRNVQICLAFRRSVKDNTGTNLLQLFGHPNIVHLPSVTTGQALYALLDSLVSPFLPGYSILLTDGQGLRCSRCPYSAHCTGCQVAREPCELSLHPSDCLTVHVDHELTPDQLTDLQLVHDDPSMAGLRSSEPTTIMDCFGAFTQSELLDEHNPWFCPRCERNQCAKKTMTVWRYPDNLIIHLKRFVYQDLSSTKVDGKVVFPHKGMDVRGFLSGPSTVGLRYDLHSIVCHMGGASAGHYTCYARHPLTHQWYYYNDETVSAQEPGESEFTSGYVLFYQRQGTEVEFTIPENNPCLEEDQSDGASPFPAGGAIPLGPPTSLASGFPFSYSSCSSKNTTPTTTTSTQELPVSTAQPQPSAAALPSSSIPTPDNTNDDEDDYDNEQRCLPCGDDDDEDDTALTIHFGSSFPNPGSIAPRVVSPVQAEGSESNEAGREVSSANEVDGPLSQTYGSSHSFVEPDSTFGFM